MTYRIVDGFSVWSEPMSLLAVTLSPQHAERASIGKGHMGNPAKVARCKLIQVPNEEGGIDTFMLAAGQSTPIDLDQDLLQQRRELREAMLVGLTAEQRAYFEADLKPIG